MSASSKEEAKRVLLEIARQSNGGAVEGKTRVFKAFYFAHLFYAAEYVGYLTEWPIVHMDYGPGIHDFCALVKELVSEGKLETEEIRTGPFKSTKYIATKLASSQQPLTDNENDSIKKAIAFVQDKTGAQLSDITHEHSRSWKNASPGGELPIYLDLLSDEDYEAEERRSARIADELAESWS